MLPVLKHSDIEDYNRIGKSLASKVAKPGDVKRSRSSRRTYRSIELPQTIKQRLGRKPTKPVTKPNLKIVIDMCGQTKVARYLKVYPSHISFWLYNDNKVPAMYTHQIANLSLGLIKAKDINSACLKIRQK